jgi:hypothetical protein
MDITIPRNGGNVEFEHTAATTSDLCLFQILKSGLEIKTLAGRNNGGNDGEIEIVAGTKYIVKIDNDDLKPVPYNGENCSYKLWKFNTVTNQWEVLQSGAFGVQEEQGSQPPPEIEVKYAKVVTTNRMPGINELQDVDLIILKNPNEPDKVYLRDGETFRQFDNGALKYAIYIIRKMNIDFDFSYIDFSYANLQGADLQGAYLRGADLQLANLQGADLQGANLQGAYLQEANLQGTFLQGANLQEANLQGANLQSANLQGANLQGADLQLANFVSANLTDAILSLSKSEFKQTVGQGNYNPQTTIWIDGNPIGE